jgi:hypothetical protein
MGIESGYTRLQKGKIIRLGNQKAKIKQFKHSLPRVPFRGGVRSPAPIKDQGTEAAIAPPVFCSGSDVIGAMDQSQACFRHINPPRSVIGNRSAEGFDNGAKTLAIGKTSVVERSPVRRFSHGDST